MRNIFIITLIVVGFIGFEAEALVQQSASDALSFNNVVKSSSQAAPSVYVKEKAPVKEKEIPEAKKLDIRNSVTKNVTLSPSQELVIVLPEKEGQSWKATYDGGQVYMIDSESNGQYREIRFGQKSSKGSTIYFDCVDSNGEVIQNKAVYVRVN